MSSPASATKTAAPCGSWISPITADVVSALDNRLGDFAPDSLGSIFWLESRPNESGRAVLVRLAEGEGSKPTDVTPKDFGVRIVAQDYGGGAFTIYGDFVVFSNDKDLRLYRQSISSNDSFPVPLTPDYGAPVVCYADGVFDSRLNRYLTIREDHRENITSPAKAIVSIDLSNPPKEPEVLVSGSDFYACPRIDARGERMAWIEWHPNMHWPWDRCELWVGYLSENGDIKKKICVAGGDQSIVESPSEPKWSPEGELFFVTDRKSGFWNIYRWVESTNEVFPVYALNAEFTRPFWNFGLNSYDFIQNPTQKNLIACNYRMYGKSYLGILDAVESKISLLYIPFTDLYNIKSGPNCLYVHGASTIRPLSLAKVILDDQKSKAVDFKVIWSSSTISPSYRPYISTPKLIEFPTEVPGQNAYAYFYPPTNPLFQPNPDEKPPLILESHGGPIAETRGILNLKIQYWTSRGWAFVDVNYGGSTGYGREYRDRLIKNWGIVDVNDCCSCAKFLAECGKVDGERLFITGGSAGGFTTLAAVAFRDTFKAGASLYGVADLKSLRSNSDKFASHLLDNLVGNDSDYFERSPINFVDKFSCPIILFQGLEDKVVLPDQARKIYQALKSKGSPVALVEYEGEHHGFRKAENIKSTIEQQMVFFARLAGHFQVADSIIPIKIDNLD